LKETLIKATEAIDYGKQTTKQSPVRNRQGLRLHSKTDPLADHFRCRRDGQRQGRGDVYAGTVEIGQGCNTIFRRCR
jgi:hypothetical protein